MEYFDGLDERFAPAVPGRQQILRLRRMDQPDYLAGMRVHPQNVSGKIDRVSEGSPPTQTTGLKLTARQFAHTIGIKPASWRLPRLSRCQLARLHKDR